MTVAASPEEVAALAYERLVYLRDGDTGSAAAVEEQLALRGYGPDGTPLRERPPQGRRRPARQKT